MFKRLFQIAILTGAAHLFTLLVLKFLSKNTSPATLSAIGEIDSIFQLLISIVGFGLQLSAVRHIAMDKNWKIIYYQTQRARIALALLMVPAALFALINPVCLFFFLAPVFALSGDYALYGRGKPVKAALWAFCRTFIPSLALILYFFIDKDQLPSAYVVSTAIIYWITGVAISRQLGFRYLIPPSFPSLRLYLDNISLGITSLVMYFLGLGLMFVASFFYHEKVLAVSYLGLKLYVIFKGIMRIINQSFIKEMVHDEMTIKSDSLSILIGTSFMGASLIFPQSIISLFFGAQYKEFEGFIGLIGSSALAMCIFISFHNRSLFKKKDKAYSGYAVLAAINSIMSVIVLSFFWQSPSSIGISLLAGEIIFTLGMLYINRDAAIFARIRFLAIAVACLAFPLAVRLVAGDHMESFLGGMTLLAVSLFVVGYGKLFKSTPKFQ